MGGSYKEWLCEAMEDWLCSDHDSAEADSCLQLAATILRDAVQEAVQQEREACAQLIESQSGLLSSMFFSKRHEPLCRDLAAAIRKRGKS